jgi:hypothetical protein
MGNFLNPLSDKQLLNSFHRSISHKNVLDKYYIKFLGHDDIELLRIHGYTECPSFILCTVASSNTNFSDIYENNNDSITCVSLRYFHVSFNNFIKLKNNLMLIQMNSGTLYKQPENGMTVNQVYNKFVVEFYQKKILCKNIQILFGINNDIMGGIYKIFTDVHYIF